MSKRYYVTFGKSVIAGGITKNERPFSWDSAHSFTRKTTTTTTIYQSFIPDNPGEPAPELSETLTQYTSLTVLKFLTSTPILPSQLTARI